MADRVKELKGKVCTGITDHRGHTVNLIVPDYQLRYGIGTGSGKKLPGVKRGTSEQLHQTVEMKLAVS